MKVMILPPFFHISIIFKITTHSHLLRQNKLFLFLFFFKVDGVNGKEYGGILGAADQERISRVTATSPLDVTAGPPGIDGGRRTLESLIAIERKRHQHLAEQGISKIKQFIDFFF